MRKVWIPSKFCCTDESAVTSGFVKRKRATSYAGSKKYRNPDEAFELSPFATIWAKALVVVAFAFTFNVCAAADTGVIVKIVTWLPDPSVIEVVFCAYLA